VSALSNGWWYFPKGATGGCSSQLATTNKQTNKPAGSSQQIIQQKSKDEDEDEGEDGKEDVEAEVPVTGPPPPTAALFQAKEVELRTGEEDEVCRLEVRFVDAAIAACDRVLTLTPIAAASQAVPVWQEGSCTGRGEQAKRHGVV
jgi:hypothetical protein